MTQQQQHPITPPPELVQQWWEQADQYQDDPKTYFDYVATEAAQWGADQELEACCEYIEQWVPSIDGLDPSKCLRAARRPKPPSLKEQALDELDGIAAVFRMSHGGDLVCDKIRRVLEQLDD